MGILKRLAQRARERTFDFTRDTRGNVTIITTVTLVTMLVTVGGAIDLLNYEVTRKKAQSALDRGVLAASSTAQGMIDGASASERETQAREIVEAYFEAANIKFPANAKVTLLEDDPNTAEDETGTGIYRRVSASGGLPVPTRFLSLIDIDQFDVPVASTAAERDQDIEISLVMDISPSMVLQKVTVNGEKKTRFEALQDAAENFFSTVLANQAARERTSINLIPFAGSVSVGRNMFDHLIGSGTREHHFSSCFAFDDNDYTETKTVYDDATGENKTVKTNEVVNFSSSMQFDHFGGHEINTNWRSLGVQPYFCPTHYNDMDTDRSFDSKPTGKDWDNTRVDNRSSITYLENDPEVLTDIVKAYQPFFATATHVGIKWGLTLLDPGFRDTLQRANTSFSGNTANAFDSEFTDRPVDFQSQGSEKILIVMADGETTSEYKVNGSCSSIKSGGGYTSRKVAHSHDANFRCVQLAYGSDRNDTKFDDICEAARTNGVRVFTIAFGASLSSDTTTRLKSCATSSADFYAVSNDIGAAFDAIAGRIQLLKLVSERGM